MKKMKILKQLKEEDLQHYCDHSKTSVYEQEGRKLKGKWAEMYILFIKVKL